MTTPLMHASASSSLDMVYLLLSYVTEHKREYLNNKDTHGNTATMYALPSFEWSLRYQIDNAKPILKALLERPCTSLNIKNNVGQTLLDIVNYHIHLLKNVRSDYRDIKSIQKYTDIAQTIKSYTEPSVTTMSRRKRRCNNLSK